MSFENENEAEAEASKAVQQHLEKKKRKTCRAGLEFTEEAYLVLGGDEGRECTYAKGYMKRQAIFSCLTCTPEGNAGVCAACCLHCHCGHEMVELWTKRNFKCDCGNSKFGAFFCKLLASKDVENSKNEYNHNFKGTYCLCDDVEVQGGEMIQCFICEDWFHVEHIGLEVPRDGEGEPLYEDFICQGCAVSCSFLTLYSQISNPAGKEYFPGVSSGPITECVLGRDLIKNPPIVENCNPIFLSKYWRGVLCRCKTCSDFYRQNGVEYLLDKEDTISAYELMAKLKGRKQEAVEDESEKLWDIVDEDELEKWMTEDEDFLNNPGHVENNELLGERVDVKELSQEEAAEAVAIEDAWKVRADVMMKIASEFYKNAMNVKPSDPSVWLQQMHDFFQEINDAYQGIKQAAP